ncbi:MAG: hypothetical protein JWQ04_1862 [Pedosphaera sp.]|nr:hypothetical protein [Pedosphaera sp.]
MIMRNNNWFGGTILCFISAAAFFHLYGGLLQFPLLLVIITTLFGSGIWLVWSSLFGQRHASAKLTAALKHTKSPTSSDKIKASLGFGMPGIVFTVIGSIALYLAAQGVIGGYESRHWPQTEGIVDVSEVSTADSQTHSGRSIKIQSAHVVYTYQISNRTYSNDRVSFLQDLTQVTSILDRYPRGKKVTVYYSAEDAGSAVLELKTPGDIWLSRALWLRLVFGVVFISMGLLFFTIQRLGFKK